MTSLLAYSIQDACKVSGIGKTRLYQLIGSGQIKAKKLGRTTFILKSDLENFLNDLQSYKTEGRA